MYFTSTGRMQVVSISMKDERHWMDRPERLGTFNRSFKKRALSIQLNTKGPILSVPLFVHVHRLPPQIEIVL